MPNTQFISGGDRVYQKLVSFWNSKSGNKLCIMYGMSEYLTQAFFNARGDTDDLGEVIPGWQVRLVDSNNQNVNDGAVGRILVKSPCQGLGYWPSTTFNDKMIDDWYDTGDLAVKINHKSYYQGRSNNDVIKNMGTFINLSNIETVILQNPMVEQAAVSLYATSLGYDELGAIVVPADPGQDKQKLLTCVRDTLGKSLSKIECPKSIILVDQIPRTDNGKVSRALVSEIISKHREDNL
jgi:acyl-coenzyme A synthetase/AMP-(fatty) acid ligase